MLITPHINTLIDSERTRAFLNAGLDLEKHRVPDMSFSSFDISESDSRWLQIRELIHDFRIPELEWTNFSPLELLQAPHVSVRPGWVNGYPQPEDDFLDVTYDLSSYCSCCGTGLLQKAPFRLSGEPSWGKRSFFHLNWVPDKIFTKPSVWEMVFEPHGVGFRPVTKRNGQILDTVVQINIPDLVPLVVPEDLGYEVCPICKLGKYSYFRRGYYPGPANPPGLAAYKSAQYFGSDSQAYRHILISNALFEDITKRKLLGLDFAACK